jgi:multiple sugar transport system ATP-binding protein
VYKNMAFGLIGKESKAEIDRRVRDAAEKLEITNLLQRKPGQLSGGQCQRVAVGRAIVRKPKVFLFDEPLSNLDAKLRVSMRVQLIELHNQLKQEGAAATMVYVTHDQVEAMTMGDRICVMNRGAIMQVDKPINLYHHPANRFVAEFIGSPSMNLHDLAIVRDGQTVRMRGCVSASGRSPCGCVRPAAPTVSRRRSSPSSAWATKSCCTANWLTCASCCAWRRCRTGSRASAKAFIWHSI